MLPPARGSNLAAAVAFLASTAAFINGVSAAADQSPYNDQQNQIDTSPAAVAARNAFVAIPVVPVAKGGEESPLVRRLRPYNTHTNGNRNRNIDDTPLPRFAGDDATRVNIGIHDPPPPDPNEEEEEQAAVDGGLVTIMATPTTAVSPTGTILSPTAAATAAGSIMENDNPTECRLLGSFAILVQLALGGLALLSLVFKRWRERPQRPVKIWFFDVSKQVFGSVLVHAANVFMSLLTSGRFSIKAATEEAVIHQGRSMMLVRKGLEVVGMVAKREEPYVPNPCSFYLLNLGIDVSFCFSFFCLWIVRRKWLTDITQTTLGIPILIIIVRVTTKLVSHTPLGKPAESVQSGNYGDPPNAWWWLKQSIIYFCGLMGMKFVVLIIFMVFPWISRIGDWALGWTEGNEKLQIVFVMMLFPLIMNAMQYYIIDSYIKKQIEGDRGDGLDSGSDTERGSVGSGTAVAGGHGGVSYGVISASDSDDEDSRSDEEDEDEMIKHGHAQRMRLTHTRSRGERDASKDREYDPAIDGDEGTIVGSTSSMTSEDRRALLAKEAISS